MNPRSKRNATITPDPAARGTHGAWRGGFRGLAARRPSRPATAAEIERNVAQKGRRRDPEMGVVPGSALADMLARLTRPDRRLLIATVLAPPTRRRARMQRRVERRIREAGLA